jgi:hypothetical protein
LPANTTINLSNLNEEYNVAIYNMLGQKVKQQTVDASNSSINISDLTLGVYVLKFEDHNNVLRFVVE